MIPAYWIDMADDSGKESRALGEVMMAERRRLVQIVRRKLFDASKADAEDLVSDVFYNVIRRGDFVTQIENLTAYVYRAIANRISDHRRSPHREQSLDTRIAGGDDLLHRALEPVSEDLTPEEALARKQLRQQIRTALDQLNARDRAVWIATEIEGRSFKELSPESGEPLGTLLSRKSRAGKTLRSLLSALGSH